MGFISFAGCAFSVCLMRPRIFPKHKRHLTYFAAFKEIPYTIFNIVMFFGFIGFYGPVSALISVIDYLTDRHRCITLDLKPSVPASQT
jgi:hypothetical protein